MSRKIDAVLPLILEDYNRFKILYKSMKKFFKDLGTCWVVVKDNEFKKLKSKINDKKYKVIKESTIILEFKKVKNIKGWYKQQLIKLAIAQKIKSSFYLTLDADLICIRPVRYSHLIEKGKALCQIEKIDYHTDWYKNVKQILGFQRSGIAYGVTPALFSKQGVLKLQDFLFERANQNNKSRKMSWRTYLIKNIPWTEYTLYFTFLEGTNLFNKYHTKPDIENICSYKNSVWYKKDFPSWKPEKSFKKKKYFFIIVQSNTGMNPKEIWAKVSKYIK